MCANGSAAWTSFRSHRMLRFRFFRRHQIRLGEMQPVNTGRFGSYAFVGENRDYRDEMF
jgi:hypothetical protein